MNTDCLRVSVVIPTLNRRQELRATLAALATQTLPPDTYEVIVVVDGSTDGTVEMLQQLRPRHRLVVVARPRRGGRAAACNEGVRRASADMLILLDDDITASERLLEEHAMYLRAHPGHAVVGAAPIAVTPDSPAVVRLVGEKMNAHLAKIAGPGFRFTERDFYSGNFAIDRALFVKVGGFDEDFTLYGNEDCELARRLGSHGVPIVYHPLAIGHQRYTKTFAQLVRDTYEKGRTRVLLGRKHPDLAGALGVMGSPRWSWKRKVLLALLERVPARTSRPAPPLLRLVALLDRAGGARSRRGYRAVLDVYFWLGVTDERRRLPVSR